MPVIIASIIGGLISACGSLVGRVLLALGIGFVAFQGFDTLMNWSLSYIQNSVTSLPSEIASFLGFCYIDKALSMIASAYTIALTIKMSGAANVTKMVMKG